jgi:hypothetical protein
MAPRQVAATMAMFHVVIFVFLLLGHVLENERHQLRGGLVDDNGYNRWVASRTE